MRLLARVLLPATAEHPTNPESARSNSAVPGSGTAVPKTSISAYPV